MRRYLSTSIALETDGETPVFLKIAIPTALTTVLMLPVAANAQFYGPGRWCAVVNNGHGNVTWDCSYASIEQCSPNVLAGSRGFCNLNPSFASGGSAYASSPCRITVVRESRHGRTVAVRRRVCD